MSGFGVVRVFVDANVLYSRTLRDWLFLMALETSPPPYGVYWSEDVLAEVVHNLRKSHPDWDAAQTGRIRQLLMRSFEAVWWTTSSSTVPSPDRMLPTHTSTLQLPDVTLLFS